MRQRMDRARWQQIENVLRGALDLSPGERSRFLAERCGGDTELLEEVGSLLEAHAVAEELTGLFPTTRERGHGGEPRGIGGPPGTAESTFGPFRVIRELGHGGMGSVFLAVRDDDEYRRMVAIKVLRGHLLSSRLRERFRAERQILADLDHPHIARMYDGGTTEAGTPYLVMEYVDGVPIDVYCARHQLGIEERLRLFLAVCSAVSHAHRHLVVHRDIKPSNVLVSREGVAKLLDFGIAKELTFDETGEDATLTGGMSAFTPGYASPEQIRERSITTATDVYSLGILLFELLTGRLPHERSLAQRMTEILAGREAPAPSAVVTPGVDRRAGPVIGSLEPKRLRQLLRGDLDAIAAAATRLAPGERYASVELLAEDVERHLEGYPVKARKGTSLYRIHKVVRRHGLEVALAAGLFLSLATAVGTLWTMTSRLRDERVQVQAERDEAQHVTAYLVDMFELSGLDPSTQDAPTTERLLARAAERTAVEFEDQPLLRATLLDTLGGIYMQLGMLDEAQPLLEDSLTARRGILEQEHVEIAESLFHLGKLAHGQGRFDEAKALLTRALELHRGQLGEAHPTVAADLHLLGNVHESAGDPESAERLYSDALRIRRQAPGTEGRPVARTLDDLGWLLIGLGRYDEAEPLVREALSIHLRIVGQRHPDVAASLKNLSDLEYARGNYKEGVDLAREALAIHRDFFTDPHPFIASALLQVGRGARRLGELGEAEGFYRQAVEMYRQLYGSDHPDIATSLNNLAVVLLAQGRWEEASGLLGEAVGMCRRLLGDAHPFVLKGTYTQARVHLMRGDPDRAHVLLHWAIENLEALGTDPAAGYFPAAFAEALLERGELTEAHRNILAALGELRSTHPDDHWRLAWAESILGGVLVEQGLYREAEPLLVQSLEKLREKRPQERWEILQAARRVSRLYEAWQKPVEAEAARRLVRELEESYPSGQRSTHDTISP